MSSNFMSDFFNIINLYQVEKSPSPRLNDVTYRPVECLNSTTVFFRVLANCWFVWSMWKFRFTKWARVERRHGFCSHIDFRREFLNAENINPRQSYHQWSITTWNILFPFIAAFSPSSEISSSRLHLPLFVVEKVRRKLLWSPTRSIYGFSIGQKWSRLRKRDGSERKSIVHFHLNRPNVIFWLRRESLNDATENWLRNDDFWSASVCIE